MRLDAPTCSYAQYQSRLRSIREPPIIFRGTTNVIVHSVAGFSQLKCIKPYKHVLRLPEDLFHGRPYHAIQRSAIAVSNHLAANYCFVRINATRVKQHAARRERGVGIDDSVEQKTKRQFRLIECQEPSTQIVLRLLAEFSGGTNPEIREIAGIFVSPLRADVGGIHDNPERQSFSRDRYGGKQLEKIFTRCEKELPHRYPVHSSAGAPSGEILHCSNRLCPAVQIVSNDSSTTNPCVWPSEASWCSSSPESAA